MKKKEERSKDFTKDFTKDFKIFVNSRFLSKEFKEWLIEEDLIEAKKGLQDSF